jgi:hypothetical protein
MARTNLLGRLARTWLTRGIERGSRAWLILGVAATTVRLVSRLARTRSETVFSQELSAGETVEVRLLPPAKR